MADRKPKRGADRPPPLSVYDGRTLIGTLAERGAFWFAYGPDDQLLARCTSQKEALRAIDLRGRS
jgi:hypothetical protein